MQHHENKLGSHWNCIGSEELLAVIIPFTIAVVVPVENKNPDALMMVILHSININSSTGR